MFMQNLPAQDSFRQKNTIGDILSNALLIDGVQTAAKYLMNHQCHSILGIHSLVRVRIMFFYLDATLALTLI